MSETPRGIIGGAKPGRRLQHDLVVFELALYRRRIVGEFSGEPVGRRGVLKKVKDRKLFVSAVAFQARLRFLILVMLFCLRTCVIFVGRNDQRGWYWSSQVRRGSNLRVHDDFTLTKRAVSQKRGVSGVTLKGNGYPISRSDRRELISLNECRVRDEEFRSFLFFLA